MKTTAQENEAAHDLSAPPVQKTCPAGHCGKVGHAHAGKKIGQFTITIVQNQPATNQAAPLEKFGPYANNVALLLQLGFKRPGACMAFLKKTDNDVGKAAEMMFAWRRERAERQKATGAAENLYAEQIAELQSRGFRWKKMMIRLLGQFDGDVDKVSEVMAERRAASEAQAKTGEVDSDDSAALYAEQMAALEEQGFKCKRMMTKLLTKFDGDVAKVSKVMGKRKAARQARAAGAVTATTAPSQEALAEELAEAGEEPRVSNPEVFYAEQIAALEEQGFKWKRLMVKLLTQFDGDVDKVSEIMATRRAAREGTKQASVAEEQAPAEGGDASQLSEEELREKLLQKFKGNAQVVDRVMARRKVQAAKREAMIQNKKQKMQMNKEERIRQKKERQQAKQAARKERIAQKLAAREARIAAKQAANPATA